MFVIMSYNTIVSRHLGLGGHDLFLEGGDTNVMRWCPLIENAKKFESIVEAQEFAIMIWGRYHALKWFLYCYFDERFYDEEATNLDPTPAFPDPIPGSLRTSDAFAPNDVRPHDEHDNHGPNDPYGTALPR